MSFTRLELTLRDDFLQSRQVRSGVDPVTGVPIGGRHRGETASVDARSTSRTWQPSANTE